MDQDIIRKRTQELESLLGVGIDLVSSTASLADASLAASLRRGETGGWYDRSSGRVGIYVPGLNGHTEALDASVIYHLLSGRGLRDLLGARYGDLCRAVYEKVAGSDVLVNSEKLTSVRMQARGDRFIQHLGPKSVQEWNLVTSCLCDLLALQNDFRLGSAVRGGETANRSERLRKAIETGDWHTVDKCIARALESEEKPALFDLGQASDSYTRIGYPGFCLSVPCGSLERMLQQNGMKSSDIVSCGFVEKMLNPLAVIEGRDTGNGEPRSYVVVTDIRTGGGRDGFVSFVLRQPSVVKAQCAGQKNPRLNTGPFIALSGWGLATALGNAENIKYLRPKEGRVSSYAVEDVLNAMRGKDARELGIKGDTASLQSLSIDSISRRLNNSTNIVTSFRNPMTGDVFVSLFGKTRDEMAMERKMSEMALLEADLPQVQRKAPSFKDKLATPVSEKFFSAEALKKMKAAGVHDAMHVISFGPEMMKTRIGPKAAKCAVAFLASLGLSYDVSRKHHTALTEAQLGGMGSEERSSALSRELFKTVCEVPDGEDVSKFSMPRCGTGEYFQGTDALYLVAKMSSFTRWEGCNVFLERGELERLGLRLQEHAEPCHIDVFGEGRTVYNLADTDLPLEHRDVFSRVLDTTREQSVAVPRFVANIIPMVKGPVMDACISYLRHVERIYQRNVTGTSLGKKPEAISRVLSRERGTTRSMGKVQSVVGKSEGGMKIKYNNRS